MYEALWQTEPEVATAIRDEAVRQHTHLELIASENFVSEAVLSATGSVFTNKYAEGYPGRRYYGGCDHVDVVERLARDRAKELFGAERANVQPHSGSQANQSVYFTALEPGDTVLGLDLAHGGHLTHGHPLNLSGRLYRFVPYGVRREDETLDYDQLARLAREHRPKLIVSGASAYPRFIDWQRIKEIADDLGLTEEELIPYGPSLAKVDYMKVLDRLKDAPPAKFIDVPLLRRPRLAKVRPRRRSV